MESLVAPTSAFLACPPWASSDRGFLLPTLALAGKRSGDGPAAHPGQAARGAHGWTGVTERGERRGDGAARPGRGGGLTSAVSLLSAPQAARC